MSVTSQTWTTSSKAASRTASTDDSHDGYTLFQEWAQHALQFGSRPTGMCIKDGHLGTKELNTSSRGLQNLAVRDSQTPDSSTAKKWPCILGFRPLHPRNTALRVRCGTQRVQQSVCSSRYASSCASRCLPALSGGHARSNPTPWKLQSHSHASAGGTAPRLCDFKILFRNA